MRKGAKQSEEARRKMSLSHTGKKLSPEHKLKLRLSVLGKPSPRKGQKLSDETRRRMSLARKGKPKSPEHIAKLAASNKGLKRSDETRQRIRESKQGVPTISETQFKKGQKPWNYIEDRSKVVVSDRQGDDRLYADWMMAVRKRDGFKCRIANGDCAGRMETHHILPWRDHKDLRYEVNNGITLCHFHHPRKRSEETRLAPVFQDLVAR